jgi:hypothetical protein
MNASTFRDGKKSPILLSDKKKTFKRSLIGSLDFGKEILKSSKRNN